MTYVRSVLLGKFKLEYSENIENIVTVVLWREPWLKPLTDMETGTDVCAVCKVGFQVMDFVTSCEFCSIGVIHDVCAHANIFFVNHKSLLDKKVVLHRDRRLHDYQ